MHPKAGSHCGNQTDAPKASTAKPEGLEISEAENG